ncbi:DUF6882 domain-containing protein [Corynebacterium lizhenjunii]|uniref:DUF6882 domain-containing protein n=1 Tax=Corynebacterium lizhenjunii TaxID=2709394 RepID=UPI0013E9A8E9|nr:DUF6882 domain-containing protein [Corynebacterium lizhenjunii]
MSVAPPRTLNDVVSDGLFIAAAQDVAFEQAMGFIQHVEYDFGTAVAAGIADAPVGVRLTTATGTHRLPARRLATVHAGRWTWATYLTASLAIPELHGTWPYRSALVAAARTLAAGAPLLFAERAGGHEVVALDFKGHGVPISHALTRALAMSTPMVDERRAAATYGHIPGAVFSGTQLYSWQPDHLGTSPTLEEIRADAHYMAIEQRLWWDANFATSSINLRRESPTASISPGRVSTGSASAGASSGGGFSGHGTFTAAAFVLALINSRAGTWRWGWAEPEWMALHEGTGNVRRFGADHGLALLLRPELPLKQAQEQQLAQVAMPILSLWTLREVPLDASTSALVFLDAPQLRLPPLRPEIRDAVLAHPAPGLDADRARAAYLRLRQT